MPLNNRIWGNAYRLTTICVDSYENGVPEGRFYNPYIEEGEQFQSLTQFLLRMETLLDGMDFPQSSTSRRSFAHAPPHEIRFPAITAARKGKLATFHLRVLFRQHASWQGSLYWMEEDREESFRSVLELILLMESALTRRFENEPEQPEEQSSA